MTSENMTTTTKTTALEALKQLRQGNQRFVTGKGLTQSTSFDPTQSTTNQNPMSIILGCSDSRVPAELVFDQGIGDLFVIRVAGNIVAPSQVGSVEFAAEQFGTRLVVVMGHSNCGAVEATLAELRLKSEDRSHNLRSIVDRIRPSVETLVGGNASNSAEELITKAIRANIAASANHLRHGSQILEQLIATEGLLIVGAEYSLKTGVVEFFDGLPA